MQDNSADEVFGRSVVTLGSIDQDRRKHIFEGIDIDTVKVVDAIEGADVARSSEVGNVSLGEEIGNVGGRINDRSSNYTNRVWDIVASDVRLQEGGMDLTGVQCLAGLGVECSNVVLRRSNQDDLGPSTDGRIDEWFGVELRHWI